MGWIKDGETIQANYLGKFVSGVVLESRVKYGGAVEYTVKLDKPVVFRWRPEPKSVVLIDDSEILIPTEGRQR